MVPTCCTTVGESFTFWGHIHDRRYNRLNSFFLRPPEALSGLGTEKCNLRAVQFLISAIFVCIMSQKEHLVPSWDGEISGWADYSRKVRLFHSQTPVSKRYTLGPKLVLRLRGKAWEVAASLDHDELSKQNGAQYLLKFLKQRLGRLPIPDVGQHLDEVFVRMRRVPGMDMISWCNLVRENYKKLQRSLSRTQAGRRSVGIQTDPSPDSGMDVTYPSSSRRAAGRSEAVLSPSNREPPDETPPRHDADGQQLDAAADAGEGS